MPVNVNRLKQVCNVAMENKSIWEDDKHLCRRYAGFCSYADFVDGSYWLVTNDGSRSALFHSNDFLRRNIDYVLATGPVIPVSSA